MDKKLLKDKAKAIKILQVIQIVFSLFLILFLFIGKPSLKTGLVLSDYLMYLSYIIVITSIVSLFIECIFEVPFIRMILMMVLFIATLNFHSNTNYLMLIFSIYGVCHLIFLIYDLCFHKEKIENLPIGIFTNKEKNLRSFLGFLVLLVCSCLYYLFYSYLTLHWLIALIIVFILALLFIIPVFIFTNPLMKTLRTFNKNCSFEILNQEIEKYKENALHPETYHYLCTLQAKYYLLVDQNKGLQILQKINPPTYNYYNNLYKIVKDYYSLEGKNAKDLKKLMLNEDVTNSSNYFNKIIHSLYHSKKSSFVQIIQIYDLMNDCYQKKDFIKANEYAQKIIQNSNDFTELKKTAKIIYGKDEPKC